MFEPNDILFSVNEDGSSYLHYREFSILCAGRPEDFRRFIEKLIEQLQGIAEESKEYCED